MICKYCKGEHDAAELCKPSRRKFFFMFGAALVGLVVAPQLIQDAIISIDGQLYKINSTEIFHERDIVAAELDKLLPKVKDLFERDDKFYSMLKKRVPEMQSARKMSVPINWR